jgi:CubicO group peptidase (beta-lactamase class C family)
MVTSDDCWVFFCLVLIPSFFKHFLIFQLLYLNFKSFFQMKKIFKFFILPLFILIVGFVLFLSIKYSPTYVYRLLKYNTADVFDCQYFHNRVIKASDSVFQFERAIDEPFVESLFNEELMITGYESFDDWAKASQTTAMIFIHRDTILYEKYYNGFDRDSLFLSQSVAKSFISTLIGFAIDEGLINSVYDPMTDYIPELKARDGRFENITIHDLLMMQSGLKYNESKIPWTNIHSPFHDEAVGYYHEDVRKLILEDVQYGIEPGQEFQYNNYNTSYLGLIIERVTGKTVSKYLEEKLWSRIMEYDALFSVDSESNGFEYMPSRLVARAIDYARFGRLFLHEGNWNGEQIISKDWSRVAISEDQNINRDIYPDYCRDGCSRDYYKYQWWGHTNCDSTFHFFANGNLGQAIYVVPEDELIIVHCGNANGLFSPDDLWHAARCFKYRDFHQSIINNGVEETIELFKSDNSQSFDEQFIDAVAFGYKFSGKKEDARLLFEFNAKMFPHSEKAIRRLSEK